MNDPHDAAKFEKDANAVAQLLAHAVRSAQARDGVVLTQKSIPEILGQLRFAEVLRDGGADLPELARVIIENSNRLHHPRYFGHQVAVPMLSSAIADLLNGVLNNGMAVYEMGPAGTAVERGVIDWMLSKAGWRSGDGVLTHGGSMANLSCLLAARARVFPEAWVEGAPDDCAIIVSETAHYSVARAAAVLGFGTRVLRKVAADMNLRMIPEALFDAVKTARHDGRRILAVVANAGATPTGAFDPIERIAPFCRAENAWLHVDGAHGASALVSPKHRGLLAGIEQADSLSWDAHKMLGTSVVCGAALVRDKSALAASYAQHAPYLFSEMEKPGEDLSKNTFECTKSMLALKLFFNLATVGESGLARHIEQLIERAGNFYEYISQRPGFECHSRPQANILCFRYGKDSAAQDRIRAAIVRDGNFYITRTTLRDEAWMRLVIMNPLTDLTDIAALCDTICGKAQGR